MKYNYMLIQYLLASACLFALSACDSVQEDPETEATTYIIQVADETFRMQTTDPDVATIADGLLASGETMNVDGPLLAGNGAFNAPYSWHLDPDHITFSPVTIELCDGTPSMVEDDLDYWLNNVGAYCPWGITVIDKIQTR